jgi:nitroreductase
MSASAELPPEAAIGEVFDVISTTRAMRRLDPERPVSAEDIERLLWAATYAPSGGNAQPVKWLVVTDQTLRSKLGDVYRRASEGIFAPYRSLAAQDPPDRIAKSVLHLVEHMGETPLMLLPCTRMPRQDTPDANFSPPWDNPLLTSASSVWPAIQNVCLMGRSLGLGVTPTVIHNILEDEVRGILALPENVIAWSILAVGHPLGRWARPQRKPPSAISYADQWGTPWGPDAYPTVGSSQPTTAEGSTDGAKGQ